MRELSTDIIRQNVKDLLIHINYNLNQPEINVIREAYNNENNPTGKNILGTLLQNIECAKELNVPICQDTGMAVIFAEIGQDVHLVGEDFETAVNKGVSEAYTEGFLRASVIRDPVFDRTNTKDNTPAVIHTRIVPGENVKLSAMAKGFGSENMAAIKMMTPTSGKNEIINFVVEAVKTAGSNPCPPIQIGIGIGGTFEKAPILAKKALLRGVGVPNPDKNYAELENEILEAVNKLDIGPQGFGGITTALGVNIEYYPTHIAGLPVAVNINCHVMRHWEKIL